MLKTGHRSQFLRLSMHTFGALESHKYAGLRLCRKR